MNVVSSLKIGSVVDICVRQLFKFQSFSLESPEAKKQTKLGQNVTLGKSTWLLKSYYFSDFNQIFLPKKTCVMKLLHEMNFQFYFKMLDYLIFYPPHDLLHTSAQATFVMLVMMISFNDCVVRIENLHPNSNKSK